MTRPQQRNVSFLQQGTRSFDRHQLVHLTELRTALNQAYQAAGRILPTYSESSIVAGQTIIKASHLNEIRNAVRALE